MRVTVVGRGKVGNGLTSWLEKGGVRVQQIAGRKGLPREADVAILAVPDDSIASVAARIGPLCPGAVLLHCAGRLDSAAFELPGRKGLGTLHPLVSFASPRHAPSGEGYCFAIGGDPKAKRAARTLVRAMGGRPLPEVQGPAYHAAAALVANGSAALALVGADILVRLGVTPARSHQAMGTLLRSVAENVERIGMPDALTGPVARGDVEAVRRHRDALLASERPTYDLVSTLILGAAKRAGLSSRRAKAIRDLLQG